MAKVLLLSADRWEMTDENNKFMAGVSLHMVNAYRNDTADSRGYKPMKTSCPSELWDSVKSMKLPCIAEVEIDMRPIANGKLGATVVAVKKIRDVELFA